MNISHLDGKLTVGRYQAPSDGNPRPRVIAAGREEIEFLTGGTGFFEVNGRQQAVGCGCILWHLPGEQTIHLNDPSHPYECLVLAFPVKGKPRRPAPRVSFWEDPLEAHAFAAEVLHAFHHDGVDRQALTFYAYTRLLWQTHVDAIKRPQNEIPWKLQLALEALNQRWNQGITLEGMAKAAKLSQPHLHHLFRKHLQNTPHRCILQRRLQEARHLLVSTDLLIKEVSFRCGFRDPVSFCRLFKIRFNTTPASYRARFTPRVR